MQLIIHSDGSIRCLYGEAINLSSLGLLSISRASHVEADPDGNWLADLRPVEGPCLGPFSLRSQALAAEEQWLLAHRLKERRV
jgi:hypothetical protein